MRIAWYGESDLEVDTFDANLPGTTGTELDDNRRVELYIVTSVAPVVPAEDPPDEPEAKKPDTKTHQDTGGSTDQREEEGALAVAAAFALDMADNETVGDHQRRRDDRRPGHGRRCAARATPTPRPLPTAGP